MPGYTLAASDKESIDPKYLCNSCGSLLREAMQTACGHFFCRSCLGNLVINESCRMTCLQDYVELNENEVFPDNFMRREVLCFSVNCTFKDEGCQWKGEVRHLEAHTSSCEFVEVPCVHPECGMLVKKTDLPQHLETECKCRPETCRFCKKQVSLNKMKLHKEKECPAYPVVCEKCNKDDIPRAKLWDHQDPLIGDCDAVQGPCPFAQIGCSRTESLNNIQRKEHLEKENGYHTALLLYHGLRMGGEMEAVLTRDPGFLPRCLHVFTNYDGIISDILAQIQTSTAENRDLRERLREHSERITSLEVTIRRLSASAQVSGNSIGSSSNDEITRRVTNLENFTAEHKALLAGNERAIGETNRTLHFYEYTLADRNVTLAQLEGKTADHDHSIEQANRSVGNLRRLVETDQETVRGLERNLAQLEGKAADHEVLFVESNRSIEQANRSVGNLRRLVATDQETVRGLERSLAQLEGKTADHEVLFVESNRSIEQANRSVGNLRRLVETDQETVRGLERRFEAIEHTLALRNVTLADLEEYIRQQEFSSYDGQLLWKITEFSRRRNEAVSGKQESFYSPCFLTSRYGFKMCARIHLNGDGMGRGTHISVFFVVMPGQYDAILHWPFKQKVTFMLLDQDNVEHVIDAFRPDPNSSSFQRPRRETNIASGCPMFCSLTELNNHAYVRDDTMFLKIIVDTTDL